MLGEGSLRLFEFRSCKGQPWVFVLPKVFKLHVDSAHKVDSLCRVVEHDFTRPEPYLLDMCPHLLQERHLRLIIWVDPLLEIGLHIASMLVDMPCQVLGKKAKVAWSFPTSLSWSSFPNLLPM